MKTTFLSSKIVSSAQCYCVVVFTFHVKFYFSCFLSLHNDDGEKIVKMVDSSRHKLFLSMLFFFFLFVDAR